MAQLLHPRCQCLILHLFSSWLMDSTAVHRKLRWTIQFGKVGAENKDWTIFLLQSVVQWCELSLLIIVWICYLFSHWVWVCCFWLRNRKRTQGVMDHGSRIRARRATVMVNSLCFCTAHVLDAATMMWKVQRAFPRLWQGSHPCLPLKFFKQLPRETSPHKHNRCCYWIVIKPLHIFECA